MDNLYKLAWIRGLKTTYYLRSLGATAAEKTSSSKPMQTIASVPAATEELVLGAGMDAPQACSILEPDCEACQ